MTDKQPEAQRLADWLEPRAESIEHVNAAALLRTQHAAIERKDALLRQALEAFEYQIKPLCMCWSGCEDCDPAKEPNLEQIAAAIKEELQ